jgi:O-antigen ligase
MAVILYGIVLFISLFVQTMSSPIAGAWLPFLGCACAMMYRPAEKVLLGRICALWLAMLGFQCYLLQPVANGAATFWVLASTPLLALSIQQQHLRKIMIASLCVLTVFAVGLILQLVLRVQYTNYNYHLDWRSAGAMAWPLVDPNNAACVLNCALIPCVWKALRSPRWWAFVGIFIFALFATASKAGAGVFLLACIVLIYERYHRRFPVGVLSIWAFIIGVAAATRFPAPVLESFHARLPIWKASWPLLWQHPWRGSGMGMFGYYYASVRTEFDTGGAFAHNDLLQFGIELGIPATLIFILLIGTPFFRVRQNTLPAVLALLGVFLQAMVEFQFFVPPVAVLTGVILAYCRLNTPVRYGSLMRNRE